MAQSKFDTKNAILYTRYNGKFNFKLLQQHAAHVEAISQKHEIKAIITDLRSLLGSYNKAMDYFKHKGYPMVKQAGLKLQVFVISDDIIINYLTEKLMDTLKSNNINCKCFSDDKEAKNWVLKELKNINE